MSESALTINDVLRNFCFQFNERDLYPKLYPLFWVHGGLQKAIVRRQLGVESDEGITLPADPKNRACCERWAEDISGVPNQDMDYEPMLVAAVDRKGRMAVFAADINTVPGTMMPGPVPVLTLTVGLSDGSRRKSWCYTDSFEDFEDLSSADNDFTSKRKDQEARERVDLFKKGLAAMIRAKFKDVEKTEAKAQKRKSEKAALEDLWAELKGHGAPLMALFDDKRLIAEVEGTLGVVRLKSRALSAHLTTEASEAERRAFANLLSAIQ